MPYADLGEVRLYYESHGEGPAVVFAHGRGGNHLNWWQQIPAFSRSFRCISFDHRGFGLSQCPPGARHKKAFADDLRALLDLLGVKRAYLVGQSMGGWTCLSFALAHPKRCVALVLANTTAGISDPAITDVLAQRGDDAGQTLTGRHFQANKAEEAFLLRQLRGLNEALNAPLPESRLAFITSASGPNAVALAEMRIPTLVIGAMQDALFPPEVMRVVARLIPGARLLLFEGAGHFVHYELPQAFNAAAIDFFRSQAI